MLWCKNLCRDLLHTEIRRKESCEHLSRVLGECCISCELELAGPEYECQQGFSSILEAIADELFSCELSTKEDCSQDSTDISNIKKAVINVDNITSPAHTLLQIQCLDQKALIYDILKISKDCNIHVYSSWLHISFDLCLLSTTLSARFGKY